MPSDGLANRPEELGARSLTAEARDAVHARVDRILDMRSGYDSEAGERGVSKRGTGHSGFGANAELIGALSIYYDCLDLAADLIGDEILVRLQPALNAELGRQIPGVSLLLDRLRMLMPNDRIRLAKHQLVALMWLDRMIEEDTHKKRPKDILGSIYGLRKDAVPKWRASVDEMLGNFAENTRFLAASVPPERFYPLVFGPDGAEMTVEQCAEAYHACARGLRRSTRRGRPRENSTD